MSAKYIIRFDDICPTMDWRAWAKIEQVLLDNGVKPILAVVPDNQDQKLAVDPERADFWDWAKQRQCDGWAIALHGYQHRYVNTNPGLLRLTWKSEFAGLSRELQREKIKKGLDILKGKGLSVDAWVAPSHSFDWTTVEVLSELEVPVISDGFWTWPYTDDRGMVWVPQQLWDGIVEKPKGIWTVCFHHNHWKPERLDRFQKNIEMFASKIISLEETIISFSRHKLSLSEKFAGFSRLLKKQAGCALFRLRQGGRIKASGNCP